MEITVNEIIALCAGDKVAAFLLLQFWNNQSIYDDKLAPKLKKNPVNVSAPVFISYLLQELVDSVTWNGAEGYPWEKETITCTALKVLKDKGYLWMIESDEGGDHRGFHCVKSRVRQDLLTLRELCSTPCIEQRRLPSLAGIFFNSSQIKLLTGS